MVADAIGGLSSTVAKGARLEFEAASGAVIEKLWTTFEHEIAADGQTGWVRGSGASRVQQRGRRWLGRRSLRR